MRLGSRSDALINVSSVDCMHCSSCLAYAVRSHTAVGEVNGRTHGNTQERERITRKSRIREWMLLNSAYHDPQQPLKA